MQARSRSSVRPEGLQVVRPLESKVEQKTRQAIEVSIVLDLSQSTFVSSLSSLAALAFLAVQQRVAL